MPPYQIDPYANVGGYGLGYSGGIYGMNTGIVDPTAQARWQYQMAHGAAKRFGTTPAPRAGGSSPTQASGTPDASGNLAWANKFPNSTANFAPDVVAERAAQQAAIQKQQQQNGGGSPTPAPQPPAAAPIAPQNQFRVNPYAPGTHTAQLTDENNTIENRYGNGVQGTITYGARTPLATSGRIIDETGDRTAEFAKAAGTKSPAPTTPFTPGTPDQPAFNPQIEAGEAMGAGTKPLGPTQQTFDAGGTGAGFRLNTGAVNPSVNSAPIGSSLPLGYTPGMTDAAHPTGSEPVPMAPQDNYRAYYQHKLANVQAGPDFLRDAANGDSRTTPVPQVDPYATSPAAANITQIENRLNRTANLMPPDLAADNLTKVPFGARLSPYRAYQNSVSSKPFQVDQYAQ